MDLVIIEKDLKNISIPKKCYHCKNEKNNMMKYLYVKDVYYCSDCFSILENVDSHFDNIFKNYDNKLDDCYNSLKEKNQKLLFLEEKVVQFEIDIKKLVEFLESLRLDSDSDQ